MAPRTVKIRHDANTRAKIKATQLVNRLQKHVDGKVDMPATAVTAAIALLRKVMPDLQNIEQKQDQNVTLRTIVTGVKREGDK